MFPGTQSICSDRADEFQGTSPIGESYGKNDAISSTSPFLDLDCHLREVKAHFFGDSTAVAYGTENSLRMNKGGRKNGVRNN